MRGLGVVLRVPTLIRGDRTQRGKCCVFSYGIGFLNKQQGAATVHLKLCAKLNSAAELIELMERPDDLFW